MRRDRGDADNANEVLPLTACLKSRYRKILQVVPAAGKLYAWNFRDLSLEDPYMLHVPLT
jgi:hypothetical protein